MSHWFRFVLACLLLMASQAAFAAPPAVWDTYSDTWVGVDGLGRALPTFATVGPPRPDRHVGIFYFLWLGEGVTGGPFDNTQILKRDPSALQKPNSPLWGPMYAPHHWGEPLFGYYLTDDAYVLRKHAQMLSDAGIEAVVFDASNKLTYKRWYSALLDVFADVRNSGGTPPSVAFLCPFWDPASTAVELYHDLYEPRIHPELWYRWDGKPLILADPSLVRPAVTLPGSGEQVPVELRPGQTLGQTFQADRPFNAVAGRLPTWETVGSAVTLTLRRDGPTGEVVARRRVQNLADNGWIFLEVGQNGGPGAYFLEASEPKGRVGWWTWTGRAGGQPFTNSRPADAATGDRTIRLGIKSAPDQDIGSFFTFRAPQPSYFAGPTAPNMWSWLEVFPQHVFVNARGEREQMSVGVAQNATNGHLGAMTDAGAHGRSFHGGREDRTPGATRRGLDFAEQFERALQKDPRFIFITGWNEWIAGRFPGKTPPVSFVDEFTQEYSRDIEPMRGGHGDDYFYQMVSFIRRYKGVRLLPPVTRRTIRLSDDFAQWKTVQPEFRDTIGDPARRSHPGWNNVTVYVNETGRSDIVTAKVAFDAQNVYFYARTAQDLQRRADGNWMLLLLNTDGNYKTGWLGYDFVVNRHSGAATASLEKNMDGGYRWSPVGTVQCQTRGREMMLAVPRAKLGKTMHIDFKWADNCIANKDWTDFTLNGDAAPNDRFNYRAEFSTGATVPAVPAHRKRPAARRVSPAASRTRNAKVLLIAPRQIGRSRPFGRPPRHVPSPSVRAT